MATEWLVLSRAEMRLLRLLRLPWWRFADWMF